MCWDVCRICLAGNVKVKMANTQLRDIYETITSNQWNRDRRPDVICYICYSSLLRCYKLREMSKQSEVIFAQFFAGGFEFSEETIPILTERQLQKLLVSPVQTFTLGFVPDNEEKTPEIKRERESIDDISMEQNDTHTHSPKKLDKTKDNQMIDEIFSSKENKQFSDTLQEKTSQFPEHSPENTKTTVRKATKRTADNNNELNESQLSENSKKTTTLTLKFNVSNSNITHNRTKDTDLLCISNDKCKSQYDCYYCDKVFTLKRFLRLHMISHGRPFFCNICHKAYSCRPYLNTHLRTHYNTKPYECNICEKAFTQSCHLQQHRRIHTGETPYSCDVCGKKFKQKSHLLQHDRTHTKEKPYSCDSCSKTFTQLSNLKQHIERIHVAGKEKPYNK